METWSGARRATVPDSGKPSQSSILNNWALPISNNIILYCYCSLLLTTIVLLFIIFISDNVEC